MGDRSVNFNLLLRLHRLSLPERVALEQMIDSADSAALKVLEGTGERSRAALACDVAEIATLKVDPDECKDLAEMVTKQGEEIAALQKSERELLQRQQERVQRLETANEDLETLRQRLSAAHIEHPLVTRAKGLTGVAVPIIAGLQRQSRLEAASQKPFPIQRY